MVFPTCYIFHMFGLIKQKKLNQPFLCTFLDSADNVLHDLVEQRFC